MRTEADLIDAIEALAAEASPYQAILARMPDREPGSTRSRTSRRWLVPAAAAIVVLATVAAALTARMFHGPHPQPAATSGPTTRYPCRTDTTPDFEGFAIDPVTDLSRTLSSVTSCAGYRSVRLYTTSGGYVGDVALYAAGAFDTALLHGARKVTGSGITGFEASVPPASTAPCIATPKRPAILALSSPCAKLPALVWQYAPHAWATMTRLNTGSGVSAQFFGSDPVAKQLSIAASVRPAVRLPILTPFRLAALAGLWPLAVMPMTVVDGVAS